MQQTSQRVLRLSGSLLTLLVLLTFNVGTTHAVGNTACGLTTVIDATDGTGNCDMAINLELPGGTLTFTNDPTLTITDGSPLATGGVALPTGVTEGVISNLGATGVGSTGTPYSITPNGGNQRLAISFATTVSDSRRGTTGWQLEASATLPSGITAALNAVTPTCTTSCAPAATFGTGAGIPVGTTGTPAGTLSDAFPLALTGAPQPFIGAPAALTGSTNHGDYSFLTQGSLTIANTAAAGINIAGTLTLTLNNADFTP